MVRRYWLICWFTIYFCRLTIDVGIICNRQRTQNFTGFLGHRKSTPTQRHRDRPLKNIRPKMKMLSFWPEICHHAIHSAYRQQRFLFQWARSAQLSSASQPANKQSHHHKTKAEAAIWKLSMRADIATSWAVRLLRLSCRQVSRKAGRQVVRGRAVPRCSISIWWWTSVAALWHFLVQHFVFLAIRYVGAIFVSSRLVDAATTSLSVC